MGKALGSVSLETRIVVEFDGCSWPEGEWEEGERERAELSCGSIWIEHSGGEDQWGFSYMFDVAPQTYEPNKRA